VSDIAAFLVLFQSSSLSKARCKECDRKPSFFERFESILNFLIQILRMSDGTGHFFSQERTVAFPHAVTGLTSGFDAISRLRGNGRIR